METSTTIRCDVCRQSNSHYGAVVKDSSDFWSGWLLRKQQQQQCRKRPAAMTNKVLSVLVVTMALLCRIDQCNCLSLTTTANARHRSSRWGLTRQQHGRLDKIICRLHLSKEEHEVDTNNSNIVILGDQSNRLKRREFLTTLGIATTLFIPLAAALAADADASTQNDLKSLEDLQLGKGQWTPPTTSTSEATTAPRSLLPAYFCAYAACFLIQFDDGVGSWWNDILFQYSLLPQDQQENQLNQHFAGLARSVQVALERFVCQTNPTHQGCCQLFSLFLERYPSPSAKRHIGLLFAMLPTELQPDLTPLATKTVSQREAMESASLKQFYPYLIDTSASNSNNKESPLLLPLPYVCAKVGNTTQFTIDPPIALYEKRADVDYTDNEEEDWSLETPPSMIYALFGVSGAAGCALTHTVVVPLDVVKTRMQTDPSLTGNNLWSSAQRIVQAEGPQGLMLGAQATIAGYSWYGLSVYPSYTFFKRFITHSLLPPAVAMIHTNDIALLAGALAAVVASLGLTPMEAARIREVADPPKYKPLGLIGTLSVIATEDTKLGWMALYAGLPSLLTRQVIFGSVKFLAFERACDAIYGTWPILSDATWTSLLVSLVAGGLSGALSSVVSHPADAVLTYAAQNSKSGSLGVLEGCRIMVEREGIGSLFRGLGSRCVWAGSIIAGQFLLYDVFRTYFGVNSGDLNQVFQVILPGGQTG